jgi:hypothetical protein
VVRWLARQAWRVRALAELRGLSEVWLFVRLVGFAASVPVLLRLPLPKLAALVSREPARADPSTQEVERLEQLVALGPRVAHPLVRTGCLTRGLTLFRFLRAAGLNVELRFGIDPSTDGHCWLTLDGEPFLEKRDPRPHYTETWRLPPVPAI